MSCNACLKQFGFFCKEIGCPNCNYSFCTKCLKKSAPIPRLNRVEHKVCLSCYDKITNGKVPETPKSPGAPPDFTASPLDDPIPEDVAANLDDVIQKRLNALKSAATTPSTSGDGPDSDEAIAIRVANLKDIPYTGKNTNDYNYLNQIDTRTDEEKSADLIKQFIGEVSIDDAVTADTKALDPISQIEARLAALRDDDDKNNGAAKQNNNIKTDGSDSDNEIDESTQAARIVQRFMEEAKLHDCPTDLTEEETEFIASVNEAKGREKNVEKELPWCHICNEDANVRCLDCDGDLFCSACFKEFHADEEDRNHRRESYRPPPKETSV